MAGAATTAGAATGARAGDGGANDTSNSVVEQAVRLQPPNKMSVLPHASIAKRRCTCPYPVPQFIPQQRKSECSAAATRDKIHINTQTWRPRSHWRWLGPP